MTGSLQRRLVLSMACVAAAVAVPATATADMTLSVGTPTLDARVAVHVPVSVSCTPFDPSLIFAGSSVGVGIEQAAGGKSIARGSGFVGMGNPAFTCDGTSQLVSVTVLADTSGPPFHGGTAVITASADASAGFDCGGICITDQQSATVGPASYHLGH